MPEVVQSEQSADDTVRSTVPDGTVEHATETGSLSIRALAAIFGVSPSTVHRDTMRRRVDRVVKDDEGNLLVPLTMGIDGKLRPAVRYNTSGRDALIRRLRAEGTTMRAIAEEVGCSVGTVHRVLRGSQ